jgi:hypothetical protein
MPQGVGLFAYILSAIHPDTNNIVPFGTRFMVRGFSRLRAKAIPVRHHTLNFTPLRALIFFC